ncbi:hypothetical protein PIB30_066383 [Stylosanthes scabra]|uniref:GAG-pre-integrase domain-containing protein n=1 Tax=Stylosanthes scabra TaxID=79078 RepID=A0ABU6UQZ0_9FABA|nr:hypothetical protein [Stylosanthes scabra]
MASRFRSFTSCTAEQSNILQHSDSNQGPEQLYVGNGKGGTKEILLKGKDEGGIYSFDNLVVSRSVKNLAPIASSYGSASSSSTPSFSKNVSFSISNMHRHNSVVNNDLNKSNDALSTSVTSLTSNTDLPHSHSAFIYSTDANINLPSSNSNASLQNNIPMTKLQNSFELWHKRLGHSNIKSPNHAGEKSSVAIQTHQGVIPIPWKPIPPSPRDNTRPPSPTPTPEQQVPQSIPNADTPLAVTTTSAPTTQPIPIYGIEVIFPIQPPTTNTSLPQPQNTHHMLTRSKTGNINPATLQFISANHLELKFTLPKTVSQASKIPHWK